MPELWSLVHRAELRRGRALGAAPLDAALGSLDSGAEPGSPPVSDAAHERAMAALAATIGERALSAALAVRRPGGPETLLPYRVVLAADRLAAAPVGEREGAVLAIAAAPATLAAYLLALLAAGRGAPTVEALAAAVGAHAAEPTARAMRSSEERARSVSENPDWLHRHLGVLGTAPGPATFLDDDGAALRLRQLSPTTCGPTCAIVLRVLLDPAYALWLTTGAHPEPDRAPDELPFEQRFRAQQQAVHSALTRRAIGPVPWPRALGSPPWALARFLNRFPALTGAQFGWVPVDAGSPGQLRRCVAAVARGVSAGVPVPVYVGRHVDRHVVLAVGSAREALRFYDPGAGEIAEVALDELCAGRAGLGGWERLESVVVPRLRSFEP